MNKELDPIFEDIFRARRFQKLIAKILRSHNLVYGEFEILHILSSSKEYKPNELALKTVQSNPRVSCLLQMLQEKKYIVMERSKMDRRCCKVKIQPRGAKLADQIYENIWHNKKLKETANEEL